jgi:hypothetical protein
MIIITFATPYESRIFIAHAKCLVSHFDFAIEI